MEELLFFGPIFTFIFIVVFRKLGSLKSRIDVLENRLNNKVSPKLAQTVVQQNTSAAAQQTISKPEPESGFSKALGDFIIWLKTDWLMKIGAFFLILALAWFVSFSFMQNWIGPVGRITLGILVGTGFLYWGHTLISKKSVPGQVIVIIGATAILLTVFAAREVYDFFTPALALGIMALTVALTAVVAIVHRTLALAVLALLGGAIAPLLTNSPSPDFVALLSYIFILDLGALMVVALRGWRPLIFLSLLITAAYSSAFFKINASIVWIFMGLFFVLFFIASTSAIWRSKKALIIDLITIVLATALVIFWIAEFVPDHMQSLVSAGVAGAAMVLSAFLFRRGSPSAAVYTHGAAAIALLGAATAFELEGEALTIAFFVETVALLAVARFGMKDTRAVWGAAFLYILPFVLSLESLDRWHDFGDEFAVILVGLFSFAVAVWILKNFFPTEKNLLPKIFSVLTALFCVALVWRVLEVLIDFRSYAHGAALVIYTIAGITLFFRGSFKIVQTEKIAGIVLLTGVTMRLLFVEIWSMSLGGRIITFMLIGALFVSTAFFKKINQHDNA